MINYIWAFLIIIGTIVGIATGNVQEISNAAVEGAKEAALLCVSLIGAYALWLGILNVAKDAGLVTALAKKMRRVIGWLFPDVKKDSEAAGFITLNIVANMLGMGNAATPFGLKAMKALQKDNPDKTTATHSMCMLLVVNASSVQIIPLTVIALRSAAGSASPAEIVFSAFLATCITTIIAVAAAKIMKRFSKCK